MSSKYAYMVCVCVGGILLIGNQLSFSLPRQPLLPWRVWLPVTPPPPHHPSSNVQSVECSLYSLYSLNEQLSSLADSSSSSSLSLSLPLSSLALSRSTRLPVTLDNLSLFVAPLSRFSEGIFVTTYAGEMVAWLGSNGQADAIDGPPTMLQP